MIFSGYGINEAIKRLILAIYYEGYGWTILFPSLSHFSPLLISNSALNKDVLYRIETEDHYVIFTNRTSRMHCRHAKEK